MSCLSSLDTFWHEPEWRRTENRALPHVVGKPHPGRGSARRPSSSWVPALLSSRAPSNGDRPAGLGKLRIRSQERLARQPDAETDGEHEHHNADQLRDREGRAELQRLVISQKLDRETGDRISESSERDHGAIARAIVEIGIR